MTYDELRLNTAQKEIRLVKVYWMGWWLRCIVRFDTNVLTVTANVYSINMLLTHVY